MKKKLLVLLIAVIPSLMPNLAFAVAIDVGIAWNSLIAISSCENDLECFGDNCWCAPGNGDF